MDFLERARIAYAVIFYAARLMRQPRAIPCELRVCKRKHFEQKPYCMSRVYCQAFIWGGMARQYCQILPLDHHIDPQLSFRMSQLKFICGFLCSCSSESEEENGGRAEEDNPIRSSVISVGRNLRRRSFLLQEKRPTMEWLSPFSTTSKRIKGAQSSSHHTPLCAYSQAFHSNRRLGGSFPPSFLPTGKTRRWTIQLCLRELEFGKDFWPIVTPAQSLNVCKRYFANKDLVDPA